jgi:DNA polymerase
MSDPRDSWLEVLQRTSSLLEVLRNGGFGYIDGRFDLPDGDALTRASAAITSSAATAGFAAPTPSTNSRAASASPAPQLVPREAIASARLDPYAHLVAPAGPARRATASAATAFPATAPPPPPAAAARAPVLAASPPLQPARRMPAVLSDQEDLMAEKNAALCDREQIFQKIASARNLETIHAMVRECCSCGLGATRTNGVPGDGNPNAELVFIGEGPGYNEDMQGKPFVGLAGQLLNDMIKAMGLRREDVYITNIVKCRPPGNREPAPEEIKACEPFLIKQLRLIAPKVICTLGRIAIQGLLHNTTPITQLRGHWLAYQGIPVMPTFHPAYLLRNPAQKRPCWEDLQQVMAKLKEGKCS